MRAHGVGLAGLSNLRPRATRLLCASRHLQESDSPPGSHGDVAMHRQRLLAHITHGTNSIRWPIALLVHTDVSDAELD